MNASRENVVCYPSAQHAEKCPITYMNIMSDNEVKKRSDLSFVKLQSDLNIVYSKKTDSLPITSMRIEDKPCADPGVFSSASGTYGLPSEVMKPSTCQLEKNTGKTFDERYSQASIFQMSEMDIMKENGVYERLYKQEAEAVGYMRYDSVSDYLVDGLKMKNFKWEKTDDYDRSKDTRKNNMQKLWFRSTIPWKLDCDSDIMGRIEA